MWKSLKDYFVAVVRWWWVIVTGAIASVVGIILNIWQDLALPVWLWVSLGFVGVVVAQFLAFHEQRRGLPDIELGEPIREPNERLTRTHMVAGPYELSTAPSPEHRVAYERLDTILHRIPVGNKGAYGPDVSVKFIGADPPIPRGLAPAILHLAGDNPDDHVSFAQSFPLHKDDLHNIDVISFSKSTPPRYFLHKIASADAAEEVQLAADSYIFKIEAFAGNVSKLQNYRVDKDSSGRLTMTRLSP